MKKTVLLFIIVLMSLTSCVSTKKDSQKDVSETDQVLENTQKEDEKENSESSGVSELQESSQDEQETISHEEDAASNETLEEENNLAEIQFEEKINESPYQEESISEDELKEDIDLLNGKTKEEQAKVNTEAEKVSESKTGTTPVQTAVKTEKENVKPAQAPKASEPVKTEQPKTQAPSSKDISKNQEAASSKTSSFDLQKEVSEITEEDHAEPVEEFIPVPSRASVIKNHQFLDIKYPGTGWIYLGELERQGLLIFYGRKVVDGNTVFTLQSKKSGTATLHFYKNDTLSQKYIDDYMTVTIGTESATDNNHETAPDYAAIVPPKPEKVVKEIPQETQTQHSELPEAQKENAKPQEKAPVFHAENSEPDLNTKTRISNSDTEENQITPEFISRNNSASKTDSAVSEKKEEAAAETQTDLLELAQKAYNEKRYEDALKLVKDFFAEATSRIDEGLYLEGQILEADSAVQDIKQSIGAYDTVVNNWPQSRLWKKARERSIYLKRFYIDIR